MLDPRAPDLAANAPTYVLSLADHATTQRPAPHPTLVREEPAYPSVPGYELLGVLGSGGMGVVYKARQRSLNRIVALKMIRPDSETDPELLARFQAEAAAVARLHHPGIVQVFEVGKCDNRPFLCLEFVAGDTLEDWIDGKPHDPHQVAGLVAQMADALHHAHTHGIIHRDMKPANVLLDETSRPRITDFGIARFLEGDSCIETRNGEILGTPAYMAPEQAGRGTIDATTDVYALGVILYEMLTGRAPFVAPTGMETIQLVLSAEPVPPRKFQPNLPRDLETICLKCLRKEPRLRYASAQALADDLRRWQEGTPIQARPLSLHHRLARWCARYPGTATLSALLALALVSLGTLGYVWHRASEDERVEQTRRAERTRAERAAIEQAVAADLAKLAAEIEAEDWPGAREALGHAAGVLQHEDLPEARARLRVYRQALDLVAQLDGIRANAGRAAEREFDHVGNEAAYRRALESVGIALHRDLASDWLEALRASPVRREIVRAVDQWAALRAQLRDFPGCYWLLALNNHLDDDDWRREARQELLDRTHAKLATRAQAARTEPRSRDQYRLLATLLHIAKNAPEALQLYRVAQLRYPDDFAFNNMLGLLLMQQKTREAYLEALGCFRAALAIRPASAGVQLNAGVMLWELGQPAEALAAYRRAAELQPDYAAAHTNQGLMLLVLERRDEAAAALERAAELRSPYPSTYYTLAKIRIQQDRLDDARKLLRYIEEHKLYEFAEMQKILGELLRRNHEALAFAERDRVLAFDPAPDLLYDQGTALHLQGRYPEAVAYLRRAVACKPDDAMYQCNLGLALLEAGEFAAGVEALCRGHALGTQGPNWRYPSGYWLADGQQLVLLERRASERPLAELLRELASKDLEHLGRLFAIQGRYRQAHLAYRHALGRATPGTDPAIRWTLAHAAVRAGLGEGVDPAPEAECAELRQQALHLLQHELGELQKLHTAGPQWRRFILGQLDARNNALETRTLRRLVAGAAFPAEERTAWRALVRAFDELRASVRTAADPAAAP